MYVMLLLYVYKKKNLDVINEQKLENIMIFSYDLSISAIVQANTNKPSGICIATSRKTK